MTIDDADFADRYGPWALVAGASEGVTMMLERVSIMGAAGDGQARS